MSARLIFVALSLVVLAACGGGGASAPSTPPVITSPAPTAAPASKTVSGHVVQLTGPLSSATWNLAAPTNCQPIAAGGSCASYPTAPPTSALPSATATLAAGAGIGGVTIYVTTATGAVTASIPNAPIASATTAPDGSFSIAVPAGTTGTVGLVALNGTSIGANGATNLGFTVAHQMATVAGASTTLYLDTLSSDERSGFTAVNAVRSAAGFPAVASDTIAEATARLSVTQRVGAAACGDYSGSFAAFSQFGGYSPVEALSWEDTAGSEWAFAESAGGNLALTPTIAYAGVSALYNVAPCGTGFQAGNINYFEAFFVE